MLLSLSMRQDTEEENDDVSESGVMEPFILPFKRYLEANRLDESTNKPMTIELQKNSMVSVLTAD